MKLPIIIFVCFIDHQSSLNIGVIISPQNEYKVDTKLKDGLSMASRENSFNETFSTYVIATSTCDVITGSRSALSLILNSSVDVIFGSLCSENCVAIAQVADYFDIPFFPFTCLDPSLDNSKVYRTTIRIFGSLTHFGYAFESVYKDNQWRMAAIITESGSYFCKNTIDSIISRFRENSIYVSEFMQLPSSLRSEDLHELSGIHNFARTIIVCHSNFTALRQIIFTAQEFGLTDPNFFVWLTFYNIYSDFPFNMLFNPWITDDDDDLTMNEMDRRKRAFLAVKIITFKNFTSLSHLKGTYTARNIRVDYLTDLSYIYALLRKKLLNGRVPVGSGSNILDASRFLEVKGRVETFTFNKDGDRLMNFLVWSLDPMSESFYPMMELVPREWNNYTCVQIGKTSWGYSSIPPLDTPSCGFSNEFCSSELEKNKLTILVAISFVLIIIILSLSFYVGLTSSRRKILKKGWKVDKSELVFLARNSQEKTSEEVVNLSGSLNRRSISCGSIILNSDRKQFKAVYKGLVVSVQCFAMVESKLTKNDLREFIELKELRHDNLVSFIGVLVENERLCLVTQFCTRGSVQDILADFDIKFEWSFKISFIYDIVKGMAYLHKSFLNYHGKLSSKVCMVTNRWVVKITGFGLTNFRHNEHLPESEIYKNQLWTAPEILRSNAICSGSQKGDVYSFAILAYEIVCREFPYHNTDLTYKEIISKIKNVEDQIFRPLIEDANADTLILDLIRRCWEEEPANRPSFDEINKKIHRNNMDIIDNILDKLEKYANNLEVLVQERTEKLLEEKKKTDLLLYRLLPPYVAEQLKAGRNVEARMYSMATVYFSDIVGFTNLSSQSTPMEIVDLLNDLYGIFDDTIARHNVYKVETIGDAYMVVSGLPQETNRHVVEICNMALDLISVVRTFKIKHRPDTMLMLRVGIHSGPCAAGVVGHIMPRYCLFGDTVNTASRMESTGEALKIHLSSSAKEELMKFPGYVVELRGPTEIKGKGLMITYWLLKKDSITEELLAEL